MTGTNKWNTKQKKIQQDFLWALGPEATHQITKSDYRTDPDNIRIDKLIKPYNRNSLPKINKDKSRGNFFCAKQIDTKTPDHWQKLLELEEECKFPQFSTEILISKLTPSITDTKLRDKLMKEKGLDVPKVVEQVQQNIYDRKKKEYHTGNPNIQLGKRHQRRAYT